LDLRLLKIGRGEGPDFWGIQPLYIQIKILAQRGPIVYLKELQTNDIENECFIRRRDF
jgi:hypothetical protein